MWDTEIGKRELLDIWVAIAIAFLLAIYHVVVNLVASLKFLSTDYTRLILHALFFWIFALLGIAYTRWRKAIAQRQELRNILASITSEVIMVVGPDRRIRMINESVNMFGYNAEEVLHKTTDFLYDDRRNDNTRPHEIRDLINTVGIHIGQATGRKRNGQTFPVEIVTASLKGREGVVIVIRDITERKRAEDAILRAKQAAEAANEEKGRLLVQLKKNFEKLQHLEVLRDNLIHMIVHDMRTPLQVILTSAEILMRTLREDRASEDCLALITGVISHTDLLTAMANAVLDVNRLETGQFPLNMSTYDLVQICREAVESVRPLAGNIEFICEKSGGEVVTYCDGDVIRRVVVNLLTNAIKFSPPGGKIRIACSRYPSHARISVTDTGPGIAPEYHKKIFEKFGQADAVPRKSRHSIGLGLAFCRLAVEAHGGSVGVESDLGKGATFWFHLPVQVPDRVGAA